ncbi:MAG: hypothetical protein IJ997_03815, partial [Mycoplasmataceae bacterium]|nr:hypothetical protein [Mycoplasmataceae bacterium]
TKTFNVSITDFNRKEKTTISDNVNLNDPTVVYNNNIHSYNLIPTISGSRTPIDNKYWNFRFLVLTALKEKQSLFGRSNNFRNVNNLTITEQDFNNVFTNFEITNSNNANGSITVSFTIKKDYVYTDNENLNKIVTFNGLRKINQTELISNNKETPLEIQSLSTINMPYNGNSLQYPAYTQGIQKITEDQLKQKLIEEVFNKDYEKAASTNGFDSGIGNLTKHLPFLKTYKDQDANNITNNEIITKNNIVLSNYEFFAAKGILKVDVQLNVWNGTENKLKHTDPLGGEDANAPIQEAPKATWYISGFKHDNVETKFNSETVWELEGLSLIKPNQFEENKDAVKKSLLDCLKANQNQNLISFPYWVNKEEVLKTIDIEFDPNCEIDNTDKKQALLKVRFNNNMWEADEQGKVSDKITNAKWQTIKIRGFLNPEPIKLQTEKLKNIRLSGNTKDLRIDENETQTFEGVDQERKQYLEIQYSVEGLNEWFTKEAFIKKLNQLNGSLDNENWIIKREDIKARYGLKQEYNNGNILIDVDGFITDNNEQLTTQKISIIDDANNNTVKGYINIDKITEQFKAENFEVRGTDKSPKLVIKNVNELNALFSRYASNNIFEILYSKNQNETNFDSSNAIWNNATNALEEKITLQNGPYTNEFSLVFKGTSNYEVYKNGQKENNGYILKTPSIKMVISIEIDNPLNNKDVKFNFKNKDNPNTAHFYQNKGGFSVKIGDKNSTNNLQEFNDFINTLFSSDQGKKDSLELAYYVSRYKLTDEELIRIHQEDLYKEIVDQNQKYDVWKTLDTTNWENDLGLLVNDYVVVTVRVKKDKLPTDDKSGYEIKYADNYIPFQSRVYGYKIKASEIQVNENSISLVNVGQAESAPYALDGYARLKHLSLVEDMDKNYLGASIKINYFNEFYTGNESQILTSGSGQVLVKREPGTDRKEYKDENGNQIQSNGSPIYLELKNGIPTAPTKSAIVQNTLELEEYSINSFRFKNFDAKELKYNFFQNQEIEFEISNKKGLATGENEFDYYLDNGTQKIKYTFKDIKFPINNDSNIRYQFETKEFMEQISNLSAYQNSSDPSEDPVNGQSKLVAKFKVTRSENKKESHTFNDLEEINRQIRTDFGGQVKLVATYTSTDGRTEKIDGGDISTIGTLKNGDRFKIEIVSTSDNLIFAQQPSPLIFAVSGLYEKPIDQELLKYLRVKQGGTIDGQGSFNILVDDPNQSNSDSDIKTLLGGYKFLVRVWDETKKIKHDWTENFISINNLNNGDKVEWKLVSP